MEGGGYIIEEIQITGRVDTVGIGTVGPVGPESELRS